MLRSVAELHLRRRVADSNCILTQEAGGRLAVLSPGSWSTSDSAVLCCDPRDGVTACGAGRGGLPAVSSALSLSVAGAGS